VRTAINAATTYLDAKQLKGAGAPSATCSAGTNLGVIYVRTDAGAASSSFYICAKTGVSTYTWEGPYSYITGAPSTWPSFATVATTGAYSDLSGRPTLFYQTLQANGTAQTQRPIVNWINGTNATVVCVDNSGATRTDCTLSATAGAGGYATVASAGTPLTARTTLNFGAEFTAVDNSGAARTDVSVNSIASTKITGLPTFPAGTILGTTDTQTVTNKTVNGVSPATFGFLDPTSSVQTQLNTKAPSSTALTGTPTNHGVAIGGAGQANTYTAVGSATQVLTSNGPGVDPTFQAAAGGGGGGSGTGYIGTLATQTANYTTSSTDTGKLIPMSVSAGGTLTLPAVVPTGVRWWVQNLNAVALTLSGNGNTLNGGGNITLGLGQMVEILSKGGTDYAVTTPVIGGGFGIVPAYLATGTRLEIDTAVVPTLPGLQTGSSNPQICTSSSASGTVYTATCNTALAGYDDKQTLFWKVDITNSGTTPTLNIDGRGAKTMVKQDGTALTAADLKVAIYRIWYDLAADKIRVVEAGLGGGGGGATNVPTIPKCTNPGTSTSATSLTTLDSVSLPSVSVGDLITVHAVWTNTGGASSDVELLFGSTDLPLLAVCCTSFTTAPNSITANINVTGSSAQIWDSIFNNGGAGAAATGGYSGTATQSISGAVTVGLRARVATTGTVTLNHWCVEYMPHQP